MTATGVAAFLEARAPSCVAAPDGTPCLKNFRQTTTTHPAYAECTGGYTGASNESAAQIVAKVGRACGINPQVLLVMLQKEQGLVKASGNSLSSSRYRSAMGYDCPDTAACDAKYYGFFNQVYSLAWQFKKYALNPAGYDHIAGRANDILFNPETTCGTSSVYIQNQATASLYNYTPFQPNAAAIAAGYYGAGDDCSTFGNRNFWLIFTDWFGSTTHQVRAAYTAVNTPVRVMETKIAGGRTSTLTMTNVPPGATAVALNVTAADPSSNTYVSVCPGGTPTADCKASSSLNPYAGRTTPNLVIVKLGAEKTVTFYNNAGVTRVLADLQGWFVDGATTGATYEPVTPFRAMPARAVRPGELITLTVPNVPAGTTAVALNVTAAAPSSNTYVSVCPGGTAPATCKAASALNPYQGSDTPNMVIVKLGAKSTVSFYNNAGTVVLLADVQGWFRDGVDTAASYVPVTPIRAMAFQPLGAAGTVTLDLDRVDSPVPVPVGATAVALNVTSTKQSTTTYVSACPAGTAVLSCKASSNLNPYAGRDVANVVIAKLGPGKDVTFYNNAGTTMLIADVQGWYVE